MSGVHPSRPGPYTSSVILVTRIHTGIPRQEAARLPVKILWSVHKTFCSPPNTHTHTTHATAKLLHQYYYHKDSLT